MPGPLADYSACPACRGSLREERGDRLACVACPAGYDVVDGIARLLPPYQDEMQLRYFRNYDRIARDDLAKPIVGNRYGLLHETLLRFIGQTTGRAVLDVGSAYGSYLLKLDARCRVAVDLSLPYLQDISLAHDVIRIWGDAEYLPVRLGMFDVVIVSDILEHMLHPEALVALLAQECRPDARIIVHVPWEESLEQYRDAAYEFVHLRRFTEYSLRALFSEFRVVREQATLPRLSDPAIFQLRSWLPRWAYEWVVGAYFGSELPYVEYAYRARWIRELPRREGWLLWLYPPQCKLFEMRRRPRRRRSWVGRAAHRWRERLETGRARQPEGVAQRPATEPVA